MLTVGKSNMDREITKQEFRELRQVRPVAEVHRLDAGLVGSVLRTRDRQTVLLYRSDCPRPDENVHQQQQWRRYVQDIPIERRSGGVVLPVSGVVAGSGTTPNCAQSFTPNKLQSDSFPATGATTGPPLVERPPRPTPAVRLPSHASRPRRASGRRFRRGRAA